jgi:hypothetical protein
MNKLTAALHDATHRVPGVPAHRAEADGPRIPARHGQRLRGAHPHLQNARRRHDAPPRILVGWQNRIARLVGARPHLTEPVATAQGEVPGGAPDSPRRR